MTMVMMMPACCGNPNVMQVRWAMRDNTGMQQSSVSAAILVGPHY